MRNIFYTTALILLFGCNELDYNDTSITNDINSCTLTAIIEHPNSSRSTINYFGNVSWSENDFIGVYGDISENAKFHFAQTNENKANFTGNLNAENENLKFAYYPYNNKAQYNGNSIVFDIPEINDYLPENKTPMIGKFLSSKKVQFYQTGGVLLVKTVGMPENSATLEISSDNDSPFLSGTVIIDKLEEDFPLFNIQVGSHTISYNISTINNKEALMDFYIPIQVGSYKKISVAIKDKNGQIIHSASLSNTDVGRGSLINTKTINCSGKLYYSKISNIENDTDWDQAYLTSVDALITSRNEANGQLTTISNIHDEESIIFITDSIGRTTNITSKDTHVNILWIDNKISSLMIINKNEVREYNDLDNQNIENALLFNQNITSRAGVDEIKIFSTISTVWNIIDVVGRLSKAIINKALKDIIQELADQYDTGIDELELLRDRDLVALAVYLEKKVNNQKTELYYSLCGATITTIAPIIKNGDIQFGYSLRNTSKIPSGNLGYDKIKRTCYASILKVPNGNRKPLNSEIICNSPKYGEMEVKIDSDKTFEIPAEKGYTYYVISRISLDAIYSISDINSEYAGQEFSTQITYSGDVESISTDNIGNIEINSIKYEYGQICFDLTIHGEQLWGRNMGIEIFNTGNNVYRNFDTMGTGNRCVLKLNKNDFDCDYNSFTAKAKGNWQIRSYVLRDLTNEICYSEFKDFDKLVYDKYPSVTFINPIIQSTEEITSRSTADENDSEKYITYFSYGLDIKGAFWINRIDAKSDTEGAIGSLSRNYIYSDGQDSFNYSWIYSKENPITPSLWYDVILHNGKTLQSSNDLRFTGCPISNIEYNNSFITTGK